MVTNVYLVLKLIEFNKKFNISLFLLAKYLKSKISKYIYKLKRQDF